MAPVVSSVKKNKFNSSSADSCIKVCRPYFVLLGENSINKNLKKNLVQNLPRSFPPVFRQSVKHLLAGNIRSDDPQFVENNVDRLKFITNPKLKEKNLKLVLALVPNEFYHQIGSALYRRCGSCK